MSTSFFSIRSGYFWGQFLGLIVHIMTSNVLLTYQISIIFDNDDNKISCNCIFACYKIKSCNEANDFFCCCLFVLCICLCTVFLFYICLAGKHTMRSNVIISANEILNMAV